MLRWSTMKRRAHAWVPWSAVVLILLGACAREPPPRDVSHAVIVRTQEPVIRAWEVPLKDVTTVASVKGVVNITRKGHILHPAVGDSIEAGDLVQVTPSSSLTLRSARGEVTLTNRYGEWFKFVQ